MGGSRARQPAGEDVQDLPRVGMGLLAGWALGMAGGVYQTVFATPWPPPT